MNEYSKDLKYDDIVANFSQDEITKMYDDNDQKIAEEESQKITQKDIEATQSNFNDFSYHQKYIIQYIDKSFIDIDIKEFAIKQINKGVRFYSSIQPFEHLRLTGYIELKNIREDEKKIFDEGVTDFKFPDGIIKKIKELTFDFDRINTMNLTEFKKEMTISNILSNGYLLTCKNEKYTRIISNKLSYKREEKLLKNAISEAYLAINDNTYDIDLDNERLQKAYSNYEVAVKKAYFCYVIIESISSLYIDAQFKTFQKLLSGNPIDYDYNDKLNDDIIPFFIDFNIDEFNLDFTPPITQIMDSLKEENEDLFDVMFHTSSIAEVNSHFHTKLSMIEYLQEIYQDHILKVISAKENLTNALVEGYYIDKTPEGQEAVLNKVIANNKTLMKKDFHDLKENIINSLDKSINTKAEKHYNIIHSRLVEFEKKVGDAIYYTREEIQDLKKEVLEMKDLMKDLTSIVETNLTKDLPNMLEKQHKQTLEATRW